MQQPNRSTSTVTGVPSVASEVSNSSSDAESGQRFEDNLATLSEMFPAYDVATLRNYLESFHDNPNCMPIIVSMLLEGDCTPGVNFGQNSTQQQCGLKHKADASTVEDSLHNEDQVATPSPSKVKRGGICRNGAKCSSSADVLREAEELKSKANILSSTTREKSSPLRSHSIKKEKPRSSNLNRSKTGSLRSPEHFASKTTSNVDKEDDLVFVKSVANSPKQSFYRTKQSNPGTTSPKQHHGICIRYKGGNLHPSMNKPKKLQIVKINADGENTPHCDQSALKRPLQLSTDIHCRSSDTCSGTVAMAANGKGNNHSPLKPCTSKGCSPSKEKATENPSVENTQECPVSTECKQMEEVTQSNNASSEGALPVAAALSDLEILKKVFPDADPTYISSLLDKYAGEPNRVALVGKELGSNPIPLHGKNTKKKAIPPVTWFWESESDKLVPFTDSECTALEKEFNSCDTQGQSSHAGVKAIRLSGSTKHFKVNFGQMIMVCESGQKTPIIRVPGGSDERKEIGGKSLIPQEALSVPSDWQQQTGSAELISVRPGSAEWDHVQRSLKRSLRAARVVDIQQGLHASMKRSCFMVPG